MEMLIKFILLIFVVALLIVTIKDALKKNDENPYH
jgi:hypothetical protein